MTYQAEKESVNGEVGTGGQESGAWGWKRVVWNLEVEDR
jgi:hypothetical protein